jgi:2-amino-4-hydroxy-6-hydroxymethyldihydropteridine diphosphokinase
MPIVYIGVGSNQGDRHENIEGSRRRLGQSGAHVRRVSPLYETEALLKPGQPPQPDFLNAVFEVETVLDPERLLDLLETIERGLGRSNKGDWSPRTIDLDILLYEDRVVDSPRLKIPHPEMAHRSFVLKPLADLARDVMHPVLKKTIKEILWNFLSTPPT